MDSSQEINLRRKCEEMWSKICELNEYCTVSDDPDTTNLDIDAMLLNISKSLMHILKKEWEDGKYNVLSNNKDELTRTATDELIHIINEYKQVEYMRNTQAAQLKASIERKKKSYSEFVLLEQGLKHKLMVQTNAVKKNEASCLLELNDKVVRAEKFHSKLVSQMTKYVVDHFGLPYQEDFNKWKKKHQMDSTNNITLDCLTPLDELIQELIDKCLHSPHDPYVAVRRSHWSPHIEMLLRYNLVSTHPEHDDFIKLIPFHI